MICKDCHMAKGDKEHSAGDFDGVDKKEVQTRMSSKCCRLAWLVEKTNTCSLFNVHTCQDTSGFFRYDDSIAVLNYIHIYFITICMHYIE